MTKNIQTNFFYRPKKIRCLKYYYTKNMISKKSLFFFYKVKKSKFPNQIFQKRIKKYSFTRITS